MCLQVLQVQLLHLFAEITRCISCSVNYNASNGKYHGVILINVDIQYNQGSAHTQYIYQKTSSPGPFEQKGNFLSICKLLCPGFDMPEEYISRLQAPNIHLHTANTIRKRWVTILGPLTVTKGRQTPLQFSSPAPPA